MSDSTPSASGVDKTHGKMVNMDEEQTKESLLEGFRQSWKEAIAGKTVPLSRLWDNKNTDK